MSDLISRKALFNELFVRDGKVCPNNDIDNFPITFNVKDIKEAIRNMPTAFDLESVIEQISNIKTDNSCTDCKYRDKCDELQEFYNPADDVDLCALTTKHLVLEILKSAANATK